jgi:signal-transduction protein with cAMP-binding, CBS, and nucleotidyltransferase domain
LGLAYLKGWGELIQIAAPDTPSNAAKQELHMTSSITSLTSMDTTFESVLTASDSYIETLSIKAIDSQPGIVELVIKTQLLSAKNPTEKRVKSRTCIERSRLIELQQCIDLYLQATAS